MQIRGEVVGAMPSDAEMQFRTGAAKFGEHWSIEEDEAVLHLLTTSGSRRAVAGIADLAQALERTADAVDWRLDTIASHLEAFRGPREHPLGLSSQLDSLLRSYERSPIAVADRARASYERVMAGERPASVHAGRLREEQQSRTCAHCFQERALDGSCGC